MTKNVLVSIKGLQFADSDVSEAATDEELDSMETICPGEYYHRNDGHFILYEELADQFSEPVKSMLKLRGKEFTVIKKGPVNVQMVFSEGEKTLTDYNTPFGNIMLAIDTKTVRVDEAESSLRIWVEYGLEVNYQFIADCSIDIHITAK
ncbi:MAG: DUF1934 domain-containing protein [Lachnospiraceae bacterium]|nr:DUF1934 domain-containing protein [Lachnospiraceae bacterium]